MSATAAWYEDNGAASGTPAKGSSRATANQVDWKSVDDIATSRNSAPIIAGDNSYHKYQFVRFTGTFTQISQGKFAHTAGTLGTGLTLVGKVTSTYATPSTAALGSATNISSVTSIGSGASVNFSTTGPEAASPSSTLTAAGYTQYMVTQLQTSSSAAAGLIGDQTLTFQWNEN